MFFTPQLLRADVFSAADKVAISTLVREKVSTAKNYLDDRHQREIGRWKALGEFSEKLAPIAREVFGDKTLKPTYSVFLGYGNDSYLTMHKDHNACVYTIDYCVTANVDWPLVVEGEEFSIPQGRALAFMGGHDLHGRNPMPDVEGARVENIMFHFCPSDHWYFTEGPEYIKVLAERGEVPSY